MGKCKLMMKILTIEGEEELYFDYKLQTSKSMVNKNRLKENFNKAAATQ